MKKRPDPVAEANQRLADAMKRVVWDDEPRWDGKTPMKEADQPMTFSMTKGIQKVVK